MNSKKGGDVINKIQDYKVFLKNFKSFRFLTFRDLFKDFVKLFLAIVFSPILIVFSVFENRIFARIIKQMLIFLYFIFILIFCYSIFTYQTYIHSNRALSIEAPFLDKVKDMK